MFKELTLATLTVSLLATPAFAFQNTPDLTADITNNDALSDAFILIGENQFKQKKSAKRHKNTQGNFAANKRRVKDTCPGGDKACIDQLKIDCDAAKGGLSTEPDGGVDCYVVGIHDQ